MPIADVPSRPRQPIHRRRQGSPSGEYFWAFYGQPWRTPTSKQTRLCVCVCTNRHMCLCVHTDTCVCVYTQTHVSMCTHRHMCLGVHRDTCVLVCTQTRVSVRAHKHMCLCVHTDTCVCVYTQTRVSVLSISNKSCSPWLVSTIYLSAHWLITSSPTQNLLLQFLQAHSLHFSFHNKKKPLHMEPLKGGVRGGREPPPEIKSNVGIYGPNCTPTLYPGGGI